MRIHLDSDKNLKRLKNLLIQIPNDVTLLTKNFEELGSKIQKSNSGLKITLSQKAIDLLNRKNVVVEDWPFPENFEDKIICTIRQCDCGCFYMQPVNPLGAWLYEDVTGIETVARIPRWLSQEVA